MEKYLFWIQGPYNQEVLEANLNALNFLNIKFKTVVCSNTKKPKNLVSGFVEYLEVKDPGIDKNEYITLNYSRQFSTTYPIFDYLKKNDHNYVIRLRSDLKIISINKFKNLIELIKKYPNMLIVSEYNTMANKNVFNYKAHISDWIYLGTPSVIEKYLTKKKRSENILQTCQNKIFLEHWVGKETCEQAMLDQDLFKTVNHEEIIVPINIVSYGITLPKYLYLFKPRSLSEFKTYVISRASIYSQNDWALKKKAKMAYSVKKLIKDGIVRIIIFLNK